MSSILTANDSQFKLSDNGEVLFQAVINSPLPGKLVATLVKGDTALLPKVALKDGVEDAAKALLENWLARHVAATLAPLKNLKITGQELPEAVQAICDKLFDAMGVIHREELSDAIANLTEETRVPIREKKIKMGPILVFLPELNKPAAVRLKAVLWSVYNNAPLPPPTPNDGVVSVKIDPETVNRDFYRVIGYPVFGPRAIRIDMLDRVINAIYDTAKDGKFQATHAMAEWLGSSIDDLYAVIRAMGHKQIPNEPEQELETQESSEKPEEAKKTPDVKPELDWFWIKKGRASEKAVRKPKQKPKADKPVRNAKKKAKIHSKKGKNEPKVFAFEAGDSESPFAVLEQLKK